MISTPHYTPVTEDTLTPTVGCDCNKGDCEAHLNPTTGVDESLTAPIMFLARRGGKLIHVCPSCTLVAQDAIVARLYNAKMDLRPFMQWDLRRVSKLLEVFAYGIPVEADYYTDQARYDAQAADVLATLKGAIKELRQAINEGDDLPAALAAMRES